MTDDIKKEVPQVRIPTVFLNRKLAVSRNVILNDSPELHNIMDRLENVRRGGRGYTARCPAHGDRNNSLSISLGDDGRILIFCFAGCSAQEIVESLGLTLRDLFPRKH